jgi:site-specific DNA-methyltransferase (adenine-specific)
MLVENQGHVPDILDCIANLSSDEVFTPPEVANQVLDLLPQEIWSNPDIKILDPCTKTGIFLRESARRLMVGLEKKIPDELERREHIFKNMLYGIAITELTGLVSRRSLYYSKDTTSEHAVVNFDSSDGNISYKRMEHEYAQGKCKVCGSPYENLERGESMENYAFQFIHDEEVGKMKFDVIVGNPPYQLESGGYGPQATPIYQLFVEQAFRLKPRYVCMITPSRWFAGGMGLDGFRQRMLDSTNFRKLVDFSNAADLFPGVEIKGGVSYFLWDKNYEGKCETLLVQDGVPGKSVSRFLGEHGDTFIRFNEAIPILEKIKAKNLDSLGDLVSGVNPFDLATNFKEFCEPKTKGAIQIFVRGGINYVTSDRITKNPTLLNSWKVLLSQAYNGGDNFPHQIIGKPFVAKPGEGCTMTYLAIGPLKNQIEADNLSEFLKTKFARFLIALKKNTQHLSKSKFDFVPKIDYSRKWNDDALYKMFGITDSEQQFIAKIVRDMGNGEE